MNETPPGTRGEPAPAPASTPRATADGADGIQELREILFEPDERRFGKIEQRLEDPARRAEDVGEILPAAIRLASAGGQKNLSAAMTPAVESALKESVQRDPRILTDAVFPVIGPAIRKSIAAAMASLVQSLNWTLTYSFSLRGLKWRWEAWRTGKSFAEVVMARTLLYRVEHVFLIHSEAGLLLRHVQAPNVAAQEPEMIAGMLTAIQDFTRDSFRVGTADKLEALEVGDLRIWIETGSMAALAAVIRGNAPLEYRVTLEGARDRIHAEQATLLTAFSGETEPFVVVQPVLEECLAIQLASGGKPSSRPVVILAILLGALLFAGVVMMLRGQSQRREAERAQQVQDEQRRAAAAQEAERQRRETEHQQEEGARWRAAVEQLKKEPGLVVISATQQADQFHLEGLRDPLAKDAAPILGGSGIEPARISTHWEPYYALTPALTLRRAAARLKPPASVVLELRDEVLVARGSATGAWIEAARTRAETVPGVARLDASAVINETEQDAAARKRAIEQFVFVFADGLTLAPPADGAGVVEVAARIEELRKIAAANGGTLRVDVVGHTSREGPDALNAKLASQRADYVRRLLTENGVPAAILAPVGRPARLPSLTDGSVDPSPGAKTVTFAVTLDMKTDKGGSR